MNPQSLNRYSYCLNNPLKYVDPSGHDEKKPWKPDFTKDDPWEDVPEDYTGYVPPGHVRVASEPDMPINFGTWGVGGNFNAGIYEGGSVSVMYVWDKYNNRGIAVTLSKGKYAGGGESTTFQVQRTNAITIFDLEGMSRSTGGSFTIGQPWLIGPSAGLNIGGEWVWADQYSGVNFNIGHGAGYFPVEFHSFEDITIVMTKDDYVDGVQRIWVIVKPYVQEFVYNCIEENAENFYIYSQSGMFPY